MPAFRLRVETGLEQLTAVDRLLRSFRREILQTPFVQLQLEASTDRSNVALQAFKDLTDALSLASALTRCNQSSLHI